MDSIPWEKGNQRLRKTALRAWEKAIRMRDGDRFDQKLNNQIHLHIHSAKGDGQLRSPPLHWRLRKEKRTRC